MYKVDLIPLHRREARRLARHVRRWVLGCSVYGAVLVVIFLLVRVGWSNGGSDLQGRLEQYQLRIDQAASDTTILRHDLSQLAAQLQAASAVGRQPDWSILMALVTETLGEDIVLRTCRLDTSTPGASTRSSPSRGSSMGTRGRGGARQGDVVSSEGLWLMIGGYGRDQPAVTQFVLRLEQEEIFDEVKLLDTQREPFLTQQAVAFRIGCALNTEKPESGATP